MTDRGERPTGRHGGSHGPAEGEVVLGRDGKPLLDRYGRPVRRRPRPAPDRARERGRHATGGGRHAKPEAPQEPSRTPRSAHPPRSERPERPERSAHSARSARPTPANKQDRHANRPPIDREKLRRERAIYDAQRANAARQNTNHDAGHGARSGSGHKHPGARPVNREQLHQSRNQQRIPSEPTRMDLGGPVAGGVTGAAAGYAQGRAAGQDRHGEMQQRRAAQQFPQQPGQQPPGQQSPYQQPPQQQRPPQNYVGQPYAQQPGQYYQQPAGYGQPGQQYQQAHADIRNPHPGAPAGRGFGKFSAAGLRAKLRRPKFGCVGCLGWPLAVLVVLLLVIAFWADAQLTRVASEPEAPIGSTKGTNWLLVGSDSRVGLSEEDIARLGTGGDIGTGRTDAIMLLHLEGTSAQLISIPRDSYVDVPGFGQDKINAAFTYGGPQLLTHTVEANTGVSIDHYAEVGMGGLANIVDAIGGVELCPSEPIDDPLANLNVGAGCQEMDGANALGYVRTRATAMGDLDRVERQREFFSALMHEATNPSTLLNPFDVFPMISSVSKSFTVGESDHVWHLARLALSMGTGVETTTVPVGGFADTDVGNVVLWDEIEAENLWNSLR
ncbi:LCP family protein [Corynebacterium propinquum]|uniref:LCP family protein n=2 Tax=Corynebacterium propinquum TaxID=43769 RepID=UPI00266F0F7A|nr:LCP family protein [Corynebacterium propinquum]WKS31384.1 LCP family protein [Corynebacterium propinquum]WKS35838.1 LCP family protein [Corynebacterium propinquum]WKS37823.1 LCP family protein [Corynebacterium propinquum]WKS42069.1 LCP family protein [Corynebacterium propinquum]WKS46242.1 LCP family protein [Corynebacterium propinquum]